MPSKDSVTKTARMNRETWEEIERVMEEDGLTFSGVIKKLVEDRVSVPQKEEETAQNFVPQNQKTEEKSFVPQKENEEDGSFVPQGISKEEYKDLENMCRVSGMTVGDFMRRVGRLFEDGYLYLDGMMLKTRGACDLRELEDVCHRINADPQEMIDRVVKSLVRG